MGTFSWWNIRKNSSTIYQLYFRIGEIKMDAIEALTTRRSCRSFKQEQIKDEELKTILDCGFKCP